ncbi:hypothetical protein D3C80_1272310 [compost metagenome]
MGQGVGAAAFGRPLAGVAFIGQGQKEQDHASRHDQSAQQRVDHEGDDQIDRSPGDIHQGDGRRTSQGGAQTVELAHRLGRGRLAWRNPASDHQSLKNLTRQQSVQAQGGPHHDPVAHGVQRRQRRQGESDDDGQPDQGEDAAGRHDAVIDLHHVDGRRQVEDIDQGAEEGGQPEVLPTGRQGGLEGLGQSA